MPNTKTSLADPWIANAAKVVILSLSFLAPLGTPVCAADPEPVWYEIRDVQRVDIGEHDSHLSYRIRDYSRQDIAVVIDSPVAGFELLLEPLQVTHPDCQTTTHYEDGSKRTRRCHGDVYSAVVRGDALSHGVVVMHGDRIVRGRIATRDGTILMKVRDVAEDIGPPTETARQNVVGPSVISIVQEPDSDDASTAIRDAASAGALVNNATQVMLHANVLSDRDYTKLEGGSDGPYICEIDPGGAKVCSDLTDAEVTILETFGWTIRLYDDELTGEVVQIRNLSIAIGSNPAPLSTPISSNILIAALDINGYFELEKGSDPLRYAFGTLFTGVDTKFYPGSNPVGWVPTAFLDLCDDWSFAVVEWIDDGNFSGQQQRLVAHEILHVLGADDDEDTACSNQCPSFLSCTDHSGTATQISSCAVSDIDVSASQVRATTPGCYRSLLCGDLTGNGSVSVVDAQYALYMAVGIVPYNPLADVFSPWGVDGVTATDALIIMRIAVGLTTVSHCGL